MRYYRMQRAAGSRRSRRFLGVLMVPLLVAGLAACEGLLEVDVPGFVTSDALNDPRLAETLVLSAQADFECGLVDYIRFPGQWYEEFLNTSQSRPDALSGLRSTLVNVYADPCDSGTGPVWSTMQLPRQQGARAVDKLLNTYPAGSVQALDFLVAKARLYEGYAIQLLGEQFCAVTIDGGPLMSRAATYAEAATRFSEAMTRANAAINAGSRVSEATAVLNAARVGRARANLYMGNNANVLTYAGAVTQGFQYLATYDNSPGRRNNRIYESDNIGDNIMPHVHYAKLTLAPNGTHTVDNGIADPRVPILEPPGVLDERGLLQRRIQMKYGGEDSEIPFSTWREAQLMIAEADPAQALAIINTLRTSTAGLHSELNTSAWPLPTISAATWAGLTAAQQLTAVREERRRELWMQGTQAGDKLRWGYPAWESTDEYGQVQATGRSWPVPFLEVTANRNLGTDPAYAGNMIDCS